MTKPELNEIITARYGGTCTRSGQRYEPGAQIARDEYGYYLAGQPDLGGEIRLCGGSGYDCDGWTVGKAYWHTPYVDGQKQDPIVVVVTRAKSTYYREDGLSFGVGDDRGYVFHGLARPATDEEAAPLIAAREVARAARAKANRQEKGLDTLFNHRVSKDSNTPEGHHSLKGRSLEIDGGFTIYGGGEELVVDADGEHVWFVRNNGMDGDDWSRNNIRTGGAGGIGTRYPLTAERRAFLDEHWPEWNTTPEPPQIEENELETL